MIISIVYTIIGLIFCFVLYLAFRAINTGMEAKKANKDLENSDKTSLDNQEDLIKKLNELKELHEKKILSDEEFIAAKKKILGETKLIVSIEASETNYWKKYTGINGLNFGINDFGKSAPYKKIYDHFKLNSESIVKKIKEKL